MMPVDLADKNSHTTVDRPKLKHINSDSETTMFAEELGGNANKRRQEEARARRRKLKEEQDKKKKAQEQRAASTAQAQAAATPVIVPVVSTLPDVVTTVEAATNGTTKNAAVAAALQQRQQRQVVQNQLKAVVTIQSFYRAHRSNVMLLEHHSKLLTQRLQDLNTLTTLLKQQKADYVPPPATATALCLQLLFLTRSLPYSSRRVPIVQLRNKVQDAIKVQKLFQLALLPGLYSQDENVNPFLVWLQTKAGQRRMEALIRLSLVIATMPNTGIQDSVVPTCLDFVRAMVGAGDKAVPASVAAIGQRLLWANSPPPFFPSPTKVVQQTTHPIAIIGSSLDWITILRYQLLYGTGGLDPIPKAAERAREACVPTADKRQTNLLCRAVLQAMQQQGNNQNLQIRYLSEILTVPLFPWKTTDVCTDILITPPAAPSTRPARPLLVQLIETFVHCHADRLGAGEISSLLPSDISLTSCPSTPTQSLLANLLSIGRFAPSLNGSQPSKLDFEAATIFYQFLATLVDSVPLATFTSRESVVEWISDGKGHHSPVVLSSVVMEQCRYLVVDSFVRNLFDCAIDTTALKTESILQEKNDKDLKQEMALQESGANAASLASKEARLDRTKGIWSSAAWARRIKGGVSKLLSTTTTTTPTATGVLPDSSEVSRRLAAGTSKADPTTSVSDRTLRINYTTGFLKSLCRVYGIVLARWGGGGGKNCLRGNAPLIRVTASGTKQEVATAIPDPCTQSLLNTFIFSTNILRALWALIQSDPEIVADVYAIIDPSKGRAPVRSFSIQPCYAIKNSLKHQKNNDGAAILFVFVSALSHALIVTDDIEIHEMGKPLPIHQLRRCIQTLKQLLYRACCIDDEPSETAAEAIVSHPADTNYFGLALVYASARTMRDLYDRSSRRPLAVPKLWLIDDLMEKEIRRCKTKDDYVRLLSTPVLRVCPFLVSFKRRLKLFERIVTTDRVAIQGENSTNPFNTNPLKPGIPIRITRGRILEDGLATMNHLGRNMRQRLAVQYFNEAGVRETGIDAGGLFKEFWTDLCAIAFDPNYALFRITEGNCMYPNPSSGAAHGTDHIMLFEFLGRILGKALYEGITVHPQFAHFFLSHLRGDYKYLNMLSDLSTMDYQLYNNIMFLKTYDGDATDLCLTFTVAVDDFGGTKEIPLMPNGANMEVTNENKQRYIQLVAKYYVVDRIKEQAEAFTRGLREVIDKAWLEIFNEPELQVLISGASDGKIDVDDMRANCRYAGGFTGIDRTVNRFWNVVASMDSKQQADLLRFVTSCERPPPLGFASLNPPFTIQRVGIMRDGDKLPSSSTCFNVLKLPTYSSEKVMKERLLYAIQSGAGFELT